MERYELAIDRAKKDLKIADHMMTVTYKLVDDPKLMLTIMQRLMSSLTYSMASILLYERLYKRIPPFTETFDSMFTMFKARLTRRYHINIEYITLIQEVKKILEEHKKSPVEFARKGKFVICSDTYKIKVVDADLIKKYINKAKLFVIEAENMVKTNGRSV